MTITPEELDNNIEYRPCDYQIRKIGTLLLRTVTHIFETADAIEDGRSSNKHYRWMIDDVIKDFEYIELQDQLAKACSDYDEAKKLLSVE